jgi:hypothetical protein
MKPAPDLRPVSDAEWLRWFARTLPLGMPGNAGCADKLREIAAAIEAQPARPPTSAP